MNNLQLLGTRFLRSQLRTLYLGKTVINKVNEITGLQLKIGDKFTVTFEEESSDDLSYIKVKHLDPNLPLPPFTDSIVSICKGNEKDPNIKIPHRIFFKKLIVHRERTLRNIYFYWDSSDNSFIITWD